MPARGTVGLDIRRAGWSKSRVVKDQPLRRSVRQAATVVSMLIGVAAFAAVMTSPHAASAQSCEAMSGPERTECFIARSRLAGAKANTAVAASQQMSDAAILARKTGTSAIPKTRRVKSRSRGR
jgi:hypothetical protein